MSVLDSLKAKWTSFNIRREPSPHCVACHGCGEIKSKHGGWHTPCMCVLGLPVELLNLDVVIPVHPKKDTQSP